MFILTCKRCFITFTSEQVSRRATGSGHLKQKHRKAHDFPHIYFEKRIRDKEAEISQMQSVYEQMRKDYFDNQRELSAYNNANKAILDQINAQLAKDDNVSASVLSSYYSKAKGVVETKKAEFLASQEYVPVRSEDNPLFEAVETLEQTKLREAQEALAKAIQVSAPVINMSILRQEEEKFLALSSFVKKEFEADWILNNLAQGLGLPSEQYKQAAIIAETLKRKTNGKITFTGHSLGGGLAATAGAATGLETVTFNAAGVHKQTLVRIDALRDNYNNIINYVTPHDVLTNFQEASIIAPDALGNNFYRDNKITEFKLRDIFIHSEAHSNI